MPQLVAGEIQLGWMIKQCGGAERGLESSKGGCQHLIAQRLLDWVRMRRSTAVAIGHQYSA